MVDFGQKVNERHPGKRVFRSLRTVRREFVSVPILGVGWGRASNSKAIGCRNDPFSRKIATDFWREEWPDVRLVVCRPGRDRGRPPANDFPRRPSFLRNFYSCRNKGMPPMQVFK